MEHAFYINLDSRPDRKQYMEDHLKQYSWWFKGQIDEINIMEKSLSTEEIKLNLLSFKK